MAETYKKIYPGNFVNQLNAYALPNDDFRKAARSVGDPQDRHHQAALVLPGWMAVRKVGVVHIDTTGTGTFDFTVCSPDMMRGAKARADIKGLWVPDGAYLSRIAFRTLPASSQPGASSSGPLDQGSANTGITGKAGETLVMHSDTVDLTVAAGSAGGPIAAGGLGTGAANTAADATGLIIDTDGNVPIGTEMIAAAFGTPQKVSNSGNGLSFSLSVKGTGATVSTVGLKTEIIGGAYIVGEVSYLVPEDVVDLDAVHISSALYSGYGS